MHQKAKPSPWHSLSLSIVAHLLVLLIAMFLIRIPPPQDKYIPSIQVELIENKSHEKSSSNGKKDHPLTNQSSTTAHTQQNGHKKHVSIKDLGIHIHGLKKEKNEGEGNPSDLLDGTGFQAGNSYKSATDKNVTLYHYIYQAIDNNLTYPSEFIDAKFQGTVVTQIYFDQTGAYLRSNSKFQSPHPYLKIHVIRTLRKGLVNAVPEAINKIRKPFFLNCSFRFYFTENGNQDLVKSQKFIVGNQLFFYRSVHKSALEWDLGPLHGVGPLANLNLLWFFEKGHDLLSKKVKFSPLEKYQDDPEW